MIELVEAGLERRAMARSLQVMAGASREIEAISVDRPHVGVHETGVTPVL
jgi:hypothetical protein